MSWVGSEIITPHRRRRQDERDGEYRVRAGELAAASVSGQAPPATPVSVAADVSISLGEDVVLSPEDDRPGGAEDSHPPVTPPRDAEMLFLGGLSTQTISAAALAQEINRSHRALSVGWTSVATDEFATAASEPQEQELNTRSILSIRADESTADTEDHNDSVDHDDEDGDDDDDDDEEHRSGDGTNFMENSPFGSDALAHSREVLFQDKDQRPPSPENDLDGSHTEFFDTGSEHSGTFEDVGAPRMAGDGNKQDGSGGAKDGEVKVDAAEKVYETAKGVWGWGKNVLVVKTFLGIAEGVACKALNVVGTTMQELDGGITDKVHGIDDGILNPAIAKIVAIVLGAAGKTEAIFKPLLLTCLKPFGLIKENGETPPTAAAATTTATAASSTTTTATPTNQGSAAQKKQQQARKEKTPPELTTKTIPLAS